MQNNIFRCQNNHCFDVAKEGYVNLLPVQHKHSKDPGDNKAMVNARRMFLEQGFYQPLRDKIVALCQHYINGKNILDAGCGEGYYTHAHQQGRQNVYGVDIAKNAVKIAAKKYKSCHFSVGSIASLPFKDEQFDWLYSIYAPIKIEEFHRLLSSDGYLLTVTPGADHLWELKQLIYQNPLKHQVTPVQYSGFDLIMEENLDYEMTFNDSQQSLNLLAMTPFAFKTSKNLIDELSSCGEFRCRADFKIRLYKKSAQSSVHQA